MDFHFCSIFVLNVGDDEKEVFSAGYGHMPYQSYAPFMLMHTYERGVT